MTRPSSERFGTIDTIVAGLGATLGAGVFTGLAPAAATAGRWMLAGAVIGAVLALCAALSTDDLAQACPGPGSTYRYAREYLGRLPGRMAGGVHLMGRLAALAALAGCFGAYVTPGRPLLGAVGILVAATVVDAVGAALSRVAATVLVAVVVLVLAMVVAVCFAISPPPPTGVPLPGGFGGAPDPRAVLSVSGVMFFGFLGFERIAGSDYGATRSVRRRAIPILLVLVLVGYLAVGAAVLRQLGPSRLAWSPTPLREAVATADASAFEPLLTFGVIAATGAALLVVMSGTTRTVAVLASAGDLPIPWASRAVGASAWVGVGAVLVALVSRPDAAIELAATCALIGYANTHAAARRLSPPDRTWSARTAGMGLGLCVLIAAAMPLVDLAVAGLAMAVVGVFGPLAARVRLIDRR